MDLMRARRQPPIRSSGEREEDWLDRCTGRAAAMDCEHLLGNDIAELILQLSDRDTNGLRRFEIVLWHAEGLSATYARRSLAG
jgi:hypothetical protein